MTPMDCKNLPGEKEETRLFTRALLIVVFGLIVFMVGLQIGIYHGRNLEKKAQQEHYRGVLEQHGMGN